MFDSVKSFGKIESYDSDKVLRFENFNIAVVIAIISALVPLVGREEMLAKLVCILLDCLEMILLRPELLLQFSIVLAHSCCVKIF